MQRNAQAQTYVFRVGHCVDVSVVEVVGRKLVSKGLWANSNKIEVPLASRVRALARDLVATAVKVMVNPQAP